MKTLNLLSAGYVVAWALIPALGVDTIYRLIAIIAVAFWFLSVNHINPKFYPKSEKLFIFGALYLLLTFVCTYLLFSSLSKSISDTVNPVIIIVLLLFYYAYEGTPFFDRLAVFAIVCFMGVSLMSIGQLVMNPQAARSAYASWNDGDTTAMESIATYGFIMSAAILSGAFLHGMINEKEKKSFKWLFGISWILTAALVLMASYFIAVLIMLISCALTLIFNFRMAKFVLIILVPIVVVFWQPLIRLLFDFLLEMSKNNIDYYIRIGELYDTIILNSAASGDLASRMDRYSKTISELFANPILGAAMIRGTYKGGGHSELLDSLAKFGVPYFACHILFIFSLPAKIIKRAGGLKLALCVIIPLVCLCFLDTYSYVMMVATAIVVPFIGNKTIGEKQECVLES